MMKLPKTTEQFIVSMVFLILFIPMIWFILLKYGDHIEILTLLIGFICGKISSVDGVYLGSTVQKKQEMPPPGNTTQETTITTATNLPTDKTT